MPALSHRARAAKGISVEACWEYFDCAKTQCIAHGRKDIRCWETEGTLCNNCAVEVRMSVEKLSKAEACARSKCIYYEVANGRERRP